MDLDILQLPGRALRGQPDPHRHPRLPGRARRGARRHLRRPLAGPDRGAGRHHRASCCPFADDDPHGPWVYWISLAFTFIGAAVFSTIRSRRARIPQEAIIGISLRGGLRRLHPGHEQGHLGERAPEGHAGGEHPGRVLAGGAGDGRALRARWARSTTSSASSSWPSPWTTRRPRPQGAQRAALGLPLLRVLRLRGDLVGGDRGRAARLLLPDRALGGGHALRGAHRAAAGHRLDHGHGRLRARHLPLGEARPAHGRDHGLHVRPGAHPDGAGAAAPVPGQAGGAASGPPDHAPVLHHEDDVLQGQDVLVGPAAGGHDVRGHPGRIAPRSFSTPSRRAALVVIICRTAGAGSRPRRSSAPGTWPTRPASGRPPGRRRCRRPW